MLVITGVLIFFHGALRSAPVLDVTFHGSVHWGSGVLDRSDTDVVVSVLRDGELLVAYTMGDRDTDGYVLPVPVSSGAGDPARAHPGDTLRFFVNGAPLPEMDHVLAEAPGSDVALDLVVPLVRLDVSGDEGVGFPSGTTWHPSGTLLQLDAPPRLIPDPGVERRLIGFSGTGAVPPQGDGAPVTILLEEDSGISWEWTTYYRLALETDPSFGGSLTATPAIPDDGYIDEGTVVRLTAAPAPGFLFREWSGDVVGRAPDVNVLVFGPRTVTARFDRDTMEDGLPDDWQLAHFGSFNVSEARPEADPDGDGRTNFEEWIAGTNPNDPSSVFRIKDQRREADSVTVTWMGVRDRRYRLLVAGDLSGPWSPYPDESPLLGADAPMEVSVPLGEDRALFFKVEVSR